MERAELTETLKNNRPNLTANSLKSYTSMLWNLNKNLFEKEKVSLEDLNETEKVLEYLQTKPISTYRTTLSALVALTENDIYKEMLLKKNKEYNEEKDKNEMNEKQKEASVSQEEIDVKYIELAEIARKLYKKKDKITRDDKQEIQNHIIMALMSGVFMPPRRLLDFTEMKIKNIDKEKDNWIDFKKKKIHYNVFKNSARMGEQVEELPDPLAKVLKRWIKINATDYMLFNVDGKKLSNVTLHDRVKKITGTNNNAFRHSFISEKYQPIIEMKQNIKKDMASMGASADVLNHYLQKK
jgi:integrase